jgi:hypothetical protein
MRPDVTRPWVASQMNTVLPLELGPAGSGGDVVTRQWRTSQYTRAVRQEAQMHRQLLKCAAVAAIATVLSSPVPRAQTAPFNFDTGNALFEVVGPPIVSALLQTTAANDAPFILRHVVVIDNAWFDAIAPYHPTAVGVYSRLGRRPASDSATLRNKNIALIYASYRIMNSLMPRFAPNWRAMVASVGLDPDNASEDITTPTGIGNVAGMRVAAAREIDGMNQLGDEGGRKYNRRPYEDYTGYKPVNTAFKLSDPSRWQPLLISPGSGTFSVQHFAMPQWALTDPYSYANPNRFHAPKPEASDYANLDEYRAQADEVIAVQAGLTDYQKMLAELFDDKLQGLGNATFFSFITRGMSLDEFVHYDFLTHIAAFDGGIATWNEKSRFDAVRPVSAIRHLYENGKITGWAGPGRGIVDNLPAREWRSYLNTGNHPEYPSGSSCFCAAYAQASRRYFRSDAFGFSMPVAAGSSVIEPGVTPATDIVLGPWSTYTEFENDCSRSRVYGGVHFTAATVEGQAMCRPVGDLAFEFLKRHIDGTVP